MFYSQSVDNIKLIVLTLDGGLLDLNRLRYNYFNRTCESYNKTITKEQFSFMLGNMKTMYDKSPIQEYISNEEFNNIVEKDLFEYAKLKQNIKREGVDELIQYCKQKNIKIAVYTTHKSKRAIQYLQLTDLYKKIDFLIGGDSKLPPLPKKDVLSVICQQMNIAPKHTLVVANFESMVEAALNIYANVIYMPDLASANDTIKACVYKVVRNYLEVMNIFLFSKYDSIEMFSPILGMNGEMDRDTLYLTRNKLIRKYQGDEQLIALVNKTYEYFVDLLNKQEISEKFSNKQRIVFSFDDDETDIQETKRNLFNASISQKFNEEKSKPQPNKETKENNLFSQVNQEKEEQINSDTFILSGATSYDPKRMNELMDIINGNSVQESVDQTEDIETKKSDDVDEVEKENKIYIVLINIIYNLLLSIIIVLLALVIGLSFKDFLSGTSIYAQIINNIFNGYMGIINGLFGFIFDSLHMIISAIPSYTKFVYENSMLSSMAALSSLSVIFNFICITCIRIMIYHFAENDE